MRPITQANHTVLLFGAALIWLASCTSPNPQYRGIPVGTEDGSADLGAGDPGQPGEPSQPTPAPPPSDPGNPTDPDPGEPGEPDPEDPGEPTDPNPGEPDPEPEPVPEPEPPVPEPTCDDWEGWSCTPGVGSCKATCGGTTITCGLLSLGCNCDEDSDGDVTPCKLPGWLLPTQPACDACAKAFDKGCCAP